MILEINGKKSMTAVKKKPDYKSNPLILYTVASQGRSGSKRYAPGNIFFYIFGVATLVLFFLRVGIFLCCGGESTKLIGRPK